MNIPGRQRMRRLIMTALLLPLVTTALSIMSSDSHIVNGRLTRIEVKYFILVKYEKNDARSASI